MARVYSSFVISSGWRREGGSLAILHDQSGEQACVDSVGAAVGWVRARAGGPSVPAAAGRAAGDGPARTGQRAAPELIAGGAG
jgi:hypothetical protein